MELKEVIRILTTYTPNAGTRAEAIKFAIIELEKIRDGKYVEKPTQLDISQSEQEPELGEISPLTFAPSLWAPSIIHEDGEQ